MTCDQIDELKLKLGKATLVKFTNCFIKSNADIVSDDLYVRNGVIQDSRKLFYDDKAMPDLIINCHGAIISPGFIDIQINGGFGYDFSDLSQNIENSLECVGKKLIEQGVTAYCPTIVTSPENTYKTLLSKSYKCDMSIAQSLGFHLEGPFISLEKSGMHNKEMIMSDFGNDPIKMLLDTYGDDLSNIKYVTLAPEIPGSCEIIKFLVDKGILVSLGHSAASFDEGVAAMECGANMLTHIFCSMLPFHHRDPHLIGLLTYDRPSALYFGIITDLVHTHATAIRIAHRANKDSLIVVTDANPAFGLPDGHFKFGSREIEVKAGSSYVTGTGVLAGATTSLDQCMRNYWSAANTTKCEALDSVTSRPADALKIGHKKGRLLSGYDADLVILDYETMRVQSTWIAGQIVYIASNVTLDVRDSLGN